MNNNLIHFLAEADAAALGLERARRDLEAAKQSLDVAKQAYDVVIAKADDLGLPRAKLKRLTEERLAALIDTGLANFAPTAETSSRSNEVKPAKPKKPARTKASDDSLAEDADASDLKARIDQESANEAEAFEAEFSAEPATEVAQ